MGESMDLTRTAHESRELDPGVPGLVTEAQRGDHEAFERLYRLHVGHVYAICLRLVADPVEAETLTQDVFVRMWQKIGTYAGRGAFGGWVRRLAINVVVEDRRAVARQSRWLEIDGEGTAIEEAGREVGGTVGGATALSRADMAIDLERAIRALPSGARVAFVLHDVYGFRHREIAEMTGVATGTVKAQLHRARRLLRHSLSGSREVMDE